MQRGLLLPRATEWFAGIAAGAVYRISNALGLWVFVSRFY